MPYVIKRTKIDLKGKNASITIDGMIKVYDDDSKTTFVEYDLHHADLNVIITDDDTSIVETTDGFLFLDNSKGIPE